LVSYLIVANAMAIYTSLLNMPLLIGFCQCQKLLWIADPKIAISSSQLTIRRS